MSYILSFCVYCERSVAEICREDGIDDPEEATDFVKVGERHIVLCEECRSRFAPDAPTGMDSLLNGPIEFPPGITAVQHICPELRARGLDEEMAEVTLEMQLSDGWYSATCPHCGVTARSRPLSGVDNRLSGEQ